MQRTVPEQGSTTQRTRRPTSAARVAVRPFKVGGLAALTGGLLVLTAGVLLVLLGAPPPRTIDLGSTGDARFLADFSIAETNDEGDSFRWSGPKSQLMLHGAGTTALRLDLRLYSSPIQQEYLQQPRRVLLHQNNTTLAAFTLSDVPGWHTYSVLLPAGTAASATLHTQPLGVALSAYTPGNNDGRRLGVPIDWIRVAPLAGGGWLVRVWHVGWLMGGLLVLWGGLTRLAAERGTWAQRAASGLVLLAAGGLVLWAWRDPYTLAWALPPLPWLIGVLALASVATWAAHNTRALPRAYQRGAVLLLVIAQVLLYTQWAVGVGVALACVGIVLLARHTDAALPATTDLHPLAAHLWPLALVFGGALTLRFYQLDALPYGLWRDEARHALLALRILEDPTYRPIYEPDGGIDLPGLGFYPFAFGLHLWGIHVWSLRPVAALAGALTVLPLYGLAWELFGRRDGALLAAALLAVSSWHLTLSRFSFPTIFDPLLTLTGLWLIVRASRRWRTTTDVASLHVGTIALSGLAGGLLGLAVQTYHTGRVVPALAGALLLVLLLHHRRAWRHWLVATLAVGVGMALAVGPLVGYALRYPESFNDRVGAVSLLVSSLEHGRAPLGVIDDSLGEHVLAFNVRGDNNGRHHAPDWPLLDAFSGLGLLVGAALLLRAWRDWRVQFVLLALAICVAPSMLAVNGPHAMRSIGAAAFACLVAALGWSYLLGCLTTLAPHWPRLRMAAGAAVVLAALCLNAWIYFAVMPPDRAVWQSFYPVHTQIGSYVRDLANEQGAAALEQVYIDQHLLENDVLRYLTHRLPVQWYDGDTFSRPVEPGAQFVLSGYIYRAQLPELADYLGAQPQPVYRGPPLPGSSDPSFVVYQVPE
ncbi:MAG: hypothetical protein HC914_09025 [Chloroflexaceae bacterium]|nr:hypothetical protein [Chloroflexaceae bacterium]